MSKEKQIEEMANHLIDIQRNFGEYCAKPCRECELGGQVNCESYYKAEALYNAGYRKQSDGEWRDRGFCKIGNKNAPVVECSECHIAFCDLINNHYYMYRYCPYCGAKMKGGAE